MKVAAIIPAAGLGIRMGRAGEERSGAGRKQFLLLEGEEILLHTVRKFVACPAIAEIIVALRADDLDWVRDRIRAVALSKPVRLATGGEHRQDSVRNGLAAVSPGIELAAVHDAVRPFVSVPLIEAVIAKAAATGAAILGIPPVDTVKQVDRVSIQSTMPRDRIVLAQTPQVFRLDLLRRAFDVAARDGFVGTDEASLVEHLDVEVSVVLGNDRNIKITKPSDLALARLFLAEERAAAAP